MKIWIKIVYFISYLDEQRKRQENKPDEEKKAMFSFR